MHRALPLLLAALTLLAPALRAETPDVLIDEQVRQNWEGRLPIDAVLKLRFTQGADLQDADLISAFWMDRDTGRFLANAVTEDGLTHRLAGIAVAQLSIPVPTRQLMPGQIVSKSDFNMVDLPLRRVGAYTVTAAEDLEGMQVRRMLSPGRPVMSQSVIQPLVITRGDKVNILYDDGRLVVTAPGRALDDAHKGQDVRIVNLVSNTPLVAIAREEGLVEVIR
ncbi:flagellar basal body P-ring formation chaperone FlgA [Sagittula salina]|uniref:Flagella basal body P-ring formation protein FlgA n=1 Tax=Sagittula salina TaxID=2820268 RepID=A0A940S2Z0_9RHOB|nr:flagellar basal body P-ring formation chaperone FlgA [Sagittula salina]MBP0484577.1 flagellar basal body P-ring formation protein FlgA [Sagittula salina]